MLRKRPPQGLPLPSRLLSLLLLGPLSLLSLPLPLAAGNTNTEARVAFSNEGSVDLEVFWRHPQSKQYSLLATIEKGAGRDINTFQGHEFFLAAAGLGTPPAIVEPNFVQKEGGEDVSGSCSVGGWPHLGRTSFPRTYFIQLFTHLFTNIQRYILKTIEGRGGAFRVDVDVIPDPTGGYRRQQSPSNGSSSSGSSSSGSSSSSVVSGAEGPQAVSVTVKNNAGAPLGVHWLDEGKGQYVKVVRAWVITVSCNYSGFVLCYLLF